MKFFTTWLGEQNGHLTEGLIYSGEMKQLFVFVKKEFYHVFRDRRTLLIMFGLPIAQILLFGFALTTEVKNADILIVDPAGDMQKIGKASGRERVCKNG